MKLEAAYAPPPSRMKRQSVETTFEYVSLGRSFKNTAGLPQGVTCCRTIPPRGGVVKRAEAAPPAWTLTSAPAPHDEVGGSCRGPPGSNTGPSTPLEASKQRPGFNPGDSASGSGLAPGPAAHRERRGTP